MIAAGAVRAPAASGPAPQPARTLAWGATTRRSRSSCPDGPPREPAPARSADGPEPLATERGVSAVAAGDVPDVSTPLPSGPRPRARLHRGGATARPVSVVGSTDRGGATPRRAPGPDPRRGQRGRSARDTGAGQPGPSGAPPGAALRCSR